MILLIYATLLANLQMFDIPFFLVILSVTFNIK